MAVIVHREDDDADLSIRLTAPITRLCFALAFVPSPFSHSKERPWDLPLLSLMHYIRLSLAVHAHITSHHGNGIVSAPSPLRPSVPGFVKHQAATSASLARLHPRSPTFKSQREREMERAWHGGQRAFALSPPAVCTPPYSRMRQRSHGEVALNPD